MPTEIGNPLVEVLSGISSGISSGVLSGICSDILSGIFSGGGLIILGFFFDQV